jgi:hypothetical protein
MEELLNLHKIGLLEIQEATIHNTFNRNISIFLRILTLYKLHLFSLRKMTKLQSVGFIIIMSMDVKNTKMIAGSALWIMITVTGAEKWGILQESAQASVMT